MKPKDRQKTHDPMSKTMGEGARKMSDTIMNLTAPKSAVARVQSLPPEVAAPPSSVDVGVENEDELANAINNLADQAANAVESSEARDKRRDTRDLILVSVSVVSTLIVTLMAYGMHRLVSPIIPALQKFEDTMGNWEIKAKKSISTLEAGEKGRRDVRLEMANSIDVNRALADSVSNLIASQTESNPKKKQQLVKKAGDSALVASVRAAEGSIAKAARRKKAPPRRAMEDLDRLKKEAETRKIDY